MKSHDSLIATGNFSEETVLTKDFLDSLNEQISEEDDYKSTFRPCDLETLKDMEI